MAPSTLLFLFLLCSSPLLAAPSLTHDPQGRLTREEYADGTVVTYVLDANGNILDEQVTKAVPLAFLEIHSGAGRIEVSTATQFPEYLVPLGTQVTFTAVPPDGGDFSGWLYDATGTTNPLVTVMTRDFMFVTT